MGATALEVIEEAHMQLEVPCEDPEHQKRTHRADIRIRATLPCGHGWLRHVCFVSWEEYHRRGVHCYRGCYSAEPLARDDVLSIVEVLR